MKIPGLFSKTAKYHKFEYKPRYYDPKKEEALLRDERIRKEMAEKAGMPLPERGSELDYRSRMTGAFQEARRRSKPQSEPNVAIIRLGIMLFIVFLLIGFLTWGPKIVYSLFLVFPVYIYFRFFKKK